MSERKPATTATTGLAGLGIAAFAVVCCAGPAVILGVVGGITLGAVMGGLAGVAVIAASVLAFIALRRRREPSSGSNPSPRQEDSR
jgi:hypothetical protein